MDAPVCPRGSGAGVFTGWGSGLRASPKNAHFATRPPPRNFRAPSPTDLSPIGTRHPRVLAPFRRTHFTHFPVTVPSKPCSRRPSPRSWPGAAGKPRRSRLSRPGTPRPPPGHSAPKSPDTARRISGTPASSPRTRAESDYHARRWGLSGGCVLPPRRPSCILHRDYTRALLHDPSGHHLLLGL